MLGFLHFLENLSHDLYRGILSPFIHIRHSGTNPPSPSPLPAGERDGVKGGLISSFERQGADGANFDAFATLGAPRLGERFILVS